MYLLAFGVVYIACNVAVINVNKSPLELKKKKKIDERER